MDAERSLDGGRATAGVVRVGETVRRPIEADRTHICLLLHHLEHKGFEGTPRFLGVDDRKREILSFLPGDVPSELGHFNDAQLTAAADLLRRFHDATADSPLVRNCGAEVMCHNDWGPTNAVFQDGFPRGLIDFDTIAPGLRLLGFGLFSFRLALGNLDYTGDEQIRRLSVMADAYGMSGCSATQIVIYAVARQTALAVSGQVQGKTEMADWAASAASWTLLNVTERLNPTGYGLQSHL